MSTRQHESPRLPLAGGGALHGTLSYEHEPGTAAVLYVHAKHSGSGASPARAMMMKSWRSRSSVRESGAGSACGAR